MAKKKNNKKSNGNTEKHVESEVKGDQVDQIEETVQKDSNATLESNKDESSGIEHSSSEIRPLQEEKEVNVEEDSESNGIHEDNVEPSDETVEKSQEATKPTQELTNDSATIALQTQLEALKLELSTKDKLIEDLRQGSGPVAHHSDDDDSQESIASLKKQLQEKTEESEKYHSNYQSLLNRLSSMKSVFSKMKEAQEELEITKDKVNSLNDENTELNSKYGVMENQISDLKSTIEELKSETLNLNSECEKLTNENSMLKKGNDIKDDENTIEIKKLSTNNKKLNLELKELKNENEEYLIMINEEKLVKQNLTHEINDLKQQLTTKEEELCESEKSNKSLMDDLNSSRQKFESSKNEFENERIELQSQIERHLVELSNSEELRSKTNVELEELKLKLNRLNELESELKTKQISIGKLRHEIIVLNEHLTKAMKLIKRDSDSESVDKELISNLFISFLQFPRGDTKKFEVLKLIASFLNWDDAKKTHAGLLHSANGLVNSNSSGGSGSGINGGSASSRSSSVIGINSNLLDPTSNTSPIPKTTESFVSLWTEFLEKESTPGMNNTK